MVIGGLVRGTNRLIDLVEPAAPPLRPLAGVGWHEALASRHAAIAAEWSEFEASGARLPLLEELVLEDQGNEGAWRAGLLVAAGRALHALARDFPETQAALAEVPGLRSALFSVMEPGVVLPEHTGPTRGVLRYHLGIRCGDGASLTVAGTTVAYRDAVAVLFDDTIPHSARNDGPGSRVTLFCELERPLPVPVRHLNRGVLSVLSLDPRYRGAGERAATLHAALNSTARAPHRRADG